MRVNKVVKRLRFYQRHLRGEYCITPWEYMVDGKYRVGLQFIGKEKGKTVTVILNQRDALSLANYLDFYKNFLRTGAPYGYDSEEKGLPIEVTTNASRS